LIFNNIHIFRLRKFILTEEHTSKEEQFNYMEYVRREHKFD